MSVIRSSEVTLLSAAPKARGVYDAETGDARVLPCDVLNVSMTESYKAMDIGHNPEYVLDIGHYDNYQGETICLFEGRRYAIIRHYTTKRLHMELTIERVIQRVDVLQ